ncbi:MAG: hypothetical protein ACI8ZF_000970, partial [Candidatus Midichloriaceae bacterium]
FDLGWVYTAKFLLFDNYLYISFLFHTKLSFNFLDILGVTVVIILPKNLSIKLFKK